ncbi:MAG: superoxide dismutase [Bacteroidota bacterium]|nr:superoxide dismutase [Bacteroidota bacterium]
MKHLKMVLFLLLTAPLLCLGQFKLPALQFRYNALEPYIDSTTMYIHYNFHHATYLNNLNKALEKYPELYKKDIVELIQNINELPADIQTPVRYNGGGYYNHSFFWTMMAPAGTAKMSAKLEKILIDNFGSIDAFKAEFEKAAVGRFGSGWAWMIKESSGKLRIISTPNQDNPLMQIATVKGKPVLALDVWEHAYYLKYQNKRLAYVKAFWNVVNWTEVERLIGQ